MSGQYNAGAAPGRTVLVDPATLNDVTPISGAQIPSALGPQPAAGSLAIIPAGSGITASASFTPIAGAYSANDVMSASKEFAFTYSDGTAIPSGSLIRILTTIVKIDATALVASEGGYDLQCYSATQPSAQADNDAWTLASGDLSSYRGAIGLGTPVDLGSALYVKSPNIDLDIKLASGSSSLWARLRTLAAFTVPATPPDRQVLLYGIVL